MNDVSKNRTVYVRNLNDRMNQYLIHELFIQAGPVDDVSLKGDFGFVTFEHDESVPYACSLLNDIALCGSNLIVKPRSGASHSDVVIEVPPTRQSIYWAQCQLQQMQQQMKWSESTGGGGRSHTRHSQYHQHGHGHSGHGHYSGRDRSPQNGSVERQHQVSSPCPQWAGNASLHGHQSSTPTNGSGRQSRSHSSTGGNEGSGGEMMGWLGGSQSQRQWISPALPAPLQEGRDSIDRPPSHHSDRERSTSSNPPVANLRPPPSRSSRHDNNASDCQQQPVLPRFLHSQSVDTVVAARRSDADDRSNKHHNHPVPDQEGHYTRQHSYHSPSSSTSRLRDRRDSDFTSSSHHHSISRSHSNHRNGSSSSHNHQQGHQQTVVTQMRSLMEIDVAATDNFANHRRLSQQHHYQEDRRHSRSGRPFP